MSNVGKLYESVIGVAVLMVLMFTKLFCQRKYSDRIKISEMIKRENQ